MHARSPPSERRREDRANGGHEQPLHRACSRPFHGPSPPVFFEREETVFERSRKHPSEEKECCPIGGSQILNVPLRRLKGLPGGACAPPGSRPALARTRSRRFVRNKSPKWKQPGHRLRKKERASAEGSWSCRVPSEDVRIRFLIRKRERKKACVCVRDNHEHKAEGASLSQEGAGTESAEGSQHDAHMGQGAYASGQQGIAHDALLAFRGQASTTREQQHVSEIHQYSPVSAPTRAGEGTSTGYGLRQTDRPGVSRCCRGLRQQWSCSLCRGLGCGASRRAWTSS